MSVELISAELIFLRFDLYQFNLPTKEHRNDINMNQIIKQILHLSNLQEDQLNI